MEIVTQRLLIRELRPEDAAALLAIEGDDEVGRYMAFERRTIEATTAHIERARTDAAAQPRHTFDLAVTLRSGGAAGAPAGAAATIAAGGELIGRCGLRVDRPEHGEAMIWYLLARSQWGRGYAREASEEMLRLGFETLKLHRMWADCDPRNLASCKLAGRLGMTYEGRVRENYRLRGEWCDTAIYGLLEDEWRQSRSRA